MAYQDIDIPLRTHSGFLLGWLQAHVSPAAFIAIDWIGMTLALIPILLRFHLRRRQLQPQPFTRNLSDALVLLSWLSGIVLIAINTWKNSVRLEYASIPASELYYGVPRDRAAQLLYVSWISLFFVYIALWAAKFALLAFYASLLRLQGRWARVTLATAALFTAATFALHMALLTRWCRPASRIWAVDGDGACSVVHDFDSVAISTTANVATDLAILCIPLFALASLLRRDIISNNNKNNNNNNAANTSLGFGSIAAAPTAAIVPDDTVRAPVSAPAAAPPSISSSSSPSHCILIGGLPFGKAELGGLALVLTMAALSISAALARFATLSLVRDAPAANITHTIDVWALVEVVASLIAVCLPSLRAFVRWKRGKRRRKRARERAKEEGERTDLETGDGVRTDLGAAGGKNGENGVGGEIESVCLGRREVMSVGAMGPEGPRRSLSFATAIEMEPGVRLGGVVDASARGADEGGSAGEAVGDDAEAGEVADARRANSSASAWSSASLGARLGLATTSEETLL